MFQSNINLNLYKSFYDVAKYGSFSKALEYTFTSQPAISKSIKKLEKELNTLCELLSKYKIPIKFIKFNPIHDLVVSTSEEDWIKELSYCIPNLRIKTYSPPGKEVGSSCGEFTKHYYHEEIESLEEKQEFENWKIKHLVYK